MYKVVLVLSLLLAVANCSPFAIVEEVKITQCRAKCSGKLSVCLLFAWLSCYRAEVCECVTLINFDVYSLATKPSQTLELGTVYCFAN